MELLRLLTRLKYEIVQGTKEAEVKKVTNDTRKIETDDVFVCIEGHSQDGHAFAMSAAQRGAKAIVVEKEIPLPRGVTVVKVPDTRYALAVMSAVSCGEPAGKLTVIGVTGTKGKTTTACMIQHVLNLAGHKTGLIGTIQVDTGRRILTNCNTTPESCQIQEYLKEMVDAGCDSVVMEVSSQGLKLERVADIPFEIGVFTNLGRDHIGPGEHQDFEEYKQCKHLLFLQCKIGIGNADDPYYADMFERTGCRQVSYGLKAGAGIRAVQTEELNRPGVLGIRYRTEGLVHIEAELPMPGLPNIYNSLAAIAVLHELKVPKEQMQEGLKSVSVRGRMEQVPTGLDCTVFIDYAHNAMSLKSLLRTLREYEPGRLVVVFGCGGNRSRERRYEMGETSGKYADYTIITSDNPRYERPEDIIEDIVTGMKCTEGHYTVIPDRRKAVAEAIREHRPLDVIVIAGKGHETYQEIQGFRYDLDDRKLIAEAIECSCGKRTEKEEKRTKEERQ